MSHKAKCQVVYGEEVQGALLVAGFARSGALQKVSKCQSGQAHHFQWKVGSQCLQVRNGYYQGISQQERDMADEVLADWLEQAEKTGEPTLVGDFNATRAELTTSRWYEAAGWYELGGAQQPARASRGGWTGCWLAVACCRLCEATRWSDGTLD